MTLEKRFNKHLFDATDRKDNNHKNNWIRKLLSLGFKPKPVVLAYDIPVPFITYLQDGDKFKPFYDYDVLDKEEKLFISISKDECTSFGFDCVNGTNGGAGETSHNRTMNGQDNPMYGEDVQDHMTEEEIVQWKKHLSESGKKRFEDLVE